MAALLCTDIIRVDHPEGLATTGFFLPPMFHPLGENTFPDSIWGEIFGGKYCLVSLEWCFPWLRWTTWVWGLAWGCPELVSYARRKPCFSCHVKDILPCTSPLCCPRELETPAGPGEQGWKGRAEWNRDVGHQDTYQGPLPAGFTTGLSDPSWRVPALKLSPTLLNWLGCPPSSMFDQEGLSWVLVRWVRVRAQIFHSLLYPGAWNELPGGAAGIVWWQMKYSLSPAG